jgi:type II secretory pathway component PulC
MTKLLAIATLTALAVGCGGAATQTEIVETDISTQIESTRVEEPEPAAPGTIKRAQLDEFLAGGPAPILALVVTEPYRERGRFVGFRIVSFTQGEPAAIDLRPGDVILAVNGRRIERPEHYFEVFEALKQADAISFDLRRDGTDQQLVYPIVP